MVAPRWGVGWLVPDPAWRSSTECGGAIPMGCDSAKNMMDGARYARPAPTARCSLRRVGARDRIGFALARALLTRCTRAPVGAPTLAATCGCSTRGLASPGGACSLRRRFSHPWALAPVDVRPRGRAPPVGARADCSLISLGNCMSEPLPAQASRDAPRMPLTVPRPSASHSPCVWIPVPVSSSAWTRRDATRVIPRSFQLAALQCCSPFMWG